MRFRLYRKNRFERQSELCSQSSWCGTNTKTSTAKDTESAKKNGPRTARSRITLSACSTALAALVLLGGTFAQVAKKRPADRGPRALGLVELAANGKAHLVPVTIMINGHFYDAGVYKADPVPMALQPETVYEAFKAGVSQGLFTVSGALPEKSGWIADGKWRSSADIEAEKAKAKAEAAKKAQSAPPPEQEIGGPPRLKRAPETPPQTTPTQTSPKTQAPPVQSPSSPSTPSSSSTPSSTKSASISEKQAAASSSSIEDANRPLLRHQAPSETTHEQTKAGNENEPLKGPLNFIPAISDAGGPEPRPYSYPMKPDEEKAFLKKMLAMAADEVRGRASHLAEESGTKPATTKKSKSVLAPDFHGAQLRVFDLATSNEAVLVLTAQAKVSSAPDLDFMVAVVARQDIYGDLHKVFAQTTDDKHLDVLPRYDLIDAVDVDGDGVGELLFRETWDSATTYAVYRVIGDQLWPLFEGKTGS